jgi:putative ABC transport system permease protein
MLKAIFANQLVLGLVQAAIVAAMAMIVTAIARRRRIRLEREIAIAMVRGLAQIVAIGSILVLLLRGPRWTSTLLLAGMMIAAAATSARRARGIPGAFRLSLYAIAAGAGSIITLMTLSGVIDSAITTLVPVGSMLIANAMNTNSLALNRFRSDVQAHVGQIEAALALGAAAPETVRPYVDTSVRASLIPAIDSIRSLGIVWIPGLMAGMVLSGSSPLYAAIYQFVVLAMIFASSSLTCLIGTALVRGSAFTAAEQLVIRPAG